MQGRGWIWLLLAGILIVGTLVPAALRRSAPAMAELERRITTEFEQQWGLEVNIATVTLASFDRVVLRNVVVRDPADGVVFTAEQVAVTYNPLRLLISRQAAAESVQSIEMVRPHLVLIREASGQWNIKRLWGKRPRSAGKTPFYGTITAREGTVTVNSGQYETQITGVAVTAVFATNPRMALTATGRKGSSPFTVAGEINVETTEILLRGELSGDSLAEYAPLIPSAAGGARAEGQWDVSLALFGNINTNLQYSGEIRLRDVSLTLADSLPAAEKIHGVIMFSNNGLFISELTGTVNGEPLTVRGQVTAGAAPYLDLTVRSEGFDFARAFPGQQVPVTGVARFNAAVFGPFNAPAANGEVILPEGKWGDIPVRDFTAHFAYNRRIISVDRITGQVYGGLVTGTGTVQLTPRSYHFFLQGTDMAAGALPVNRPVLTGKLSGTALVSGEGGRDAVRIWSNLQVRDGSMAGVRFEQADAGIFWDGGRLVLDYANITSGDGKVSIFGQIGRDQKLALTARGTRLPLARLSALWRQPVVTGTADFTGQITGSVTSPEVKGAFNATNGKVLEQPFTTATGQLEFARERLLLDSVILTHGSTTNYVDGAVTWSGRGVTLDLHVINKGADAADVARLILPGETVTGVVDNAVSIQGPAANPTYKGRFILSNATFRGQIIDLAEGAYTFAQHTVTLQGVTIYSRGSRILLSGAVGGPNGLNLNIDARGVALEKLPLSLPYPVQGQVDITGRLTGTRDTPDFTGEVSATGLAINGQPFTKLTGSVTCTTGQVNISSLILEDNLGTYTFQGTISTDGETAVDGTLTINRGQVRHLLALADIPAQDINGDVNGSIILRGTAVNPTGHAILVVTNGQIRGNPVQRLIVDVTAANRLITINNLRMEQGTGGLLVARGTADLDGPLAIEVGGSNLDAGCLAGLFPNAPHITGKVNFTTQVTGTAARPFIATSLEIKNGSLANAEFDAMYGLVLFEQDVLHVNQIMLVRGPYRASIYGRIPLAALSKERRTPLPGEASMDVQMKLEQADLSILPLLWREVAWARGETKGQIRITGTLAQPYFQGGIAIHDGSLKLRSLADPVTDIETDIRLAGDQIHVARFTGAMGGGTYRLTGQMGLAGLALSDVALRLSLDKLYVNHKIYKGPIIAELDAAGPVNDLSLRGRVVIGNATVTLPSRWAAPGKVPFNLRLDVEVQVRDRVRLYNAYFYDLQGQGKLRIQGSPAEPLVTGRLTATRGAINYLHTQFRVSDGWAEFSEYGSFEPTVHLEARTRVARTDIFLTVHGKVSAMEVALTSQPGMSQAEIISLLTLRNRGTGATPRSGETPEGQPGSGSEPGTGEQPDGNQRLDRDEMMALLNQGLQYTFVSRVETIFKGALGLDEFQLVRADGEEITEKEVYNLEIGKYVHDRLFLGYTLGIDNANRLINFRYQLVRNISVDWQIDENDAQRIGLEARFRFN